MERVEKELKPTSLRVDSHNYVIHMEIIIILQYLKTNYPLDNFCSDVLSITWKRHESNATRVSHDGNSWWVVQAKILLKCMYDQVNEQTVCRIYQAEGKEACMQGKSTFWASGGKSSLDVLISGLDSLSFSPSTSSSEETALSLMLPASSSNFLLNSFSSMPGSVWGSGARG